MNAENVTLLIARCKNLGHENAKLAKKIHSQRLAFAEMQTHFRLLMKEAADKIGKDTNLVVTLSSQVHLLKTENRSLRILIADFKNEAAQMQRLEELEARLKKLEQV